MAVCRDLTLLIIIFINVNVHISISQALEYNISQSELDTCQKYKTSLHHKYVDFFLVNKKSSGIAANETLHLKFYVMTFADAHILLTTFPVLMDTDYEIVIGCNADLRADIRINDKIMYYVDFKNILSDSELTPIEVIQKNDGHLLVYIPGIPVTPLLEYFFPKPIEINYVSFTSYGGVTGKWFHSCDFDGFGAQISGNCTAPDNCRCNKGFSYKDYKNNTCEPVCEEGCSNGECIEPGKCRCCSGYKNSTKNVCEPLCEGGCRNGECIAPGTCECYFGYYKNFENLCEPVCRGGCINGNCTAPDNCTCNERYVPSKTDKNKCDPVCNIDCSYGTCSAPDICTCNYLYTWSNKKRQCVLY